MPTAPCPGPPGGRPSALSFAAARTNHPRCARVPGLPLLDPALLQLPLRVLNLTARAVHCLSDVPTIAALLDYTEVQLVARRNFGRTSLLDVRRKLVHFVVDGSGAAAAHPVREAFYDPHPAFVALWRTPPQDRPLRVVVAELVALLSQPDELRQAEPWPYSTAAIGPPPAINVTDASLQEVVEALFACLKPRERRVLARRYGALGARPATLAEVGRELGLTRERVRQIVQCCLARLGTDTERRRREPLMARIRECLEQAGGVIHERELAAALSRRFHPAHEERGEGPWIPPPVSPPMERLDLGPTLRILMGLDEAFHATGAQVWALASESAARVAAIQQAFYARLVAASRPVSLAALIEELCRESNGELSPAFLQACLDAEPRIYRAEVDLYGLVAWRKEPPPTPRDAQSAVPAGAPEGAAAGDRTAQTGSYAPS